LKPQQGRWFNFYRSSVKLPEQFKYFHVLLHFIPHYDNEITLIMTSKNMLHQFIVQQKISQVAVLTAKL